MLTYESRARGSLNSDVDRLSSRKVARRAFVNLNPIKPHHRTSNGSRNLWSIIVIIEWREQYVSWSWICVIAKISGKERHDRSAREEKCERVHDIANNPGLGGPTLRSLLSHRWSSSIAVTAAVLPGWHPEAVGQDKDASHLVLQWNGSPAAPPHVDGMGGWFLRSSKGRSVVHHTHPMIRLSVSTAQCVRAS